MVSFGMPLVASSVLAYSATLIIALSVATSVRMVIGAAALVSACVFQRAGRQVAALLSAICGAAVLAATSVAASDTTCSARLVASSDWSADFDADVAAGDVVHVEARHGGCAARATLLVSAGAVRGGTHAAFAGRASADARGLFIEDVHIGASSGAPVLVALRAAAGRRIDRIFGDDAPMARALVIADMSAIPTEQRDRFATSGLVHMLSVSGLHVGIVALSFELVASVLRLPVAPARIISLVLLALYVAAIGAPPPAVRAAVMLSALLVCRLLQRPTSPWAILALGALAPLGDPRTALDLGWQLSVAGTASLISGAALARRVIPPAWRGSRRMLATGGIVSLVATAVTAPIVAWAFGRVSLLGPVTNLLADPVMGLLQPLLFLALALPVPVAERIAADASHALLMAFDGIARAAASVPFAAPSVLPTALSAILAGAASVAVLVACSARQPARAVLVAACCMAAVILEPLAPHGASPPELHMIDVGQGDALAIRTSRGRWIVVDAGRAWPAGDAGRSVVAPYLAHRGGDVALFVLSHPHADHVGGAASLFTLMRPARFLDPGYVGTSPPYRAALGAARALSIPWQRVRPGDSLIVDDVVLMPLAPDSAWAAQLADANLASTVLVARLGGHTVLLTGDAEAPEEDWLLEHAINALHADVLKVAHHGSATSTTARFLDAVHPRLALVSVGAHNSYGHPDADVIAALRVAGVPTLRTDRLGTVVLRFLPQGIDVVARGLHWRLPDRLIK